ncbi:hydroxyacylglutathione hydrolase [Bordetella genomosp. 12]|uniref:Hydroxyacylglutathione hydrolase n=1 Tax=Bordetella genomosp. 12 TaxID=463035 RepID=A0A261VUP3_9BORD|nr:hydroxyacylglutathione hydrolase [Bordetella genomosp. 12]OZI77547.1 hydroxyacylglutathione hydrolase [Bordetella genomosp. 12]
MPAHTLTSGHASLVVPIEAFTDNYIWAVVRDGDAVVVDPGQAQPVQDFLQRHGLRLRAILLTHHHADHVGGVLQLRAAAAVPVYGPARESLPHCDFRMQEGDLVDIPELGLSLTVLDVPGHTAGHIAYVGHAGDLPLLFCGDTLFAGGCGRLFEGTPAQMHASLEKLGTLPEDTQVFCAHEYTLANLRWATTVEPANPALQLWQEQARQMRADGRPTLPTSIGKERATNPFLRTQQAEVAKAALTWAGHPLSSSVDVFAALRDWKNNFK